MAKEVQDLTDIINEKKFKTNPNSNDETVVQTENKLSENKLIVDKPLKQQSSFTQTPPNVEDTKSKSSFNSYNEFKTIENSSSSDDHIQNNENSFSEKSIYSPSKSDSCISTQNIRRNVMKQNLNLFNRKMVTAHSHHQNPSFPKRDVKSSQQQVNENVNLVHATISRQDVRRSMSSIPSMFQRFRSAVTLIKSKLFLDESIRFHQPHNKYSDRVCNRCLDVLLSDEFNAHSKDDANTKCSKYVKENRIGSNYRKQSSWMDKKSSKSNEGVKESSYSSLSYVKSKNGNPKRTLSHDNMILSTTVPNSLTPQLSFSKEHFGTVAHINELFPPSAVAETNKIIHQYSLKSIYNPQPVDLRKSSTENSQKLSTIDFLIALIREDLRLGSDDLLEMENNLKEFYETNSIFNRDLNLTLQLGCPYWNQNKRRRMKSCQDIIRVLACLKKIRFIYQPHKISILKQIEKEVTDKFLLYYCNSRNPKLVCPVFIPVKSEKQIYY